jgi:ABC-type ATPase involved in cell division
LISKEKIVELAAVTLSNEAGLRIFDSLNLILCSGETALIIGPTGSGKTSLMELLIGTRKPDSGEIILFGKTLNLKNESQINEIRRRIGGVGGIFDLVPGLTVADNLIYPLSIRGDALSVQRAKLKQILTQFNLLSKKREQISNLTRAEKLLVMLGRAVIADQPLLLIDEPLDRLEAAAANEILGILKRLSVAGHAMIIFTTSRGAFDFPGVMSFHIKDGRLQ